MQNDTITYDTIDSRPLPKWLIDQKSGVTTIQPQEIVMREDNYLKTSFIVTAVIILILVTFLTVYFHRKNKNQL